MKHTVKIMLIALLFTLALYVTGTTVDAAEKKTKTYKTRTVEIMRGYCKDVKTSKRIRRVKICSKNKHFAANLLYTKKRNKFEVENSDYGKIQAVKVIYTNGWTQKIKIKTVLSTYEKKILDELKPLLADPDNGLKKVLASMMGNLNSFHYYEPELVFVNANLRTVSKVSLDEVIKNYSVSEKKALILERYFEKRMTYSMANRRSCSDSGYLNDKLYKKLYKGTFKGVCQDGAVMANSICELVGMKSVWISCGGINHAWCTVYVTDKNGISYWKGVSATSFAFSLKKSIGISVRNVGKENYASRSISKKKIKKYVCKKALTQWNKALRRRSQKAITAITSTSPTPTVKPTPTPVPTIKPTVIPSQMPTGTPGQRIVIPASEHHYTCPGCDSPYRHIKPSNPYISNSQVLYKNVTIYEHVVNGISRYFDANGNEYVDVNHNDDIMDELGTVFG